MERLGVLSGIFMLERSDWVRKGKKHRIQNAYGEATAIETDCAVFILRHGDDPAHYILPHRINHAANLQALKDFGVTEAIGINSTGSLKTNLRPGMIVIPDDFITFTPTPTIYESKPIHITPSFNESVRRKLIAAARKIDRNTVESGIYWQTSGPRLETRAEIRMMSRFADIVGMTLAGEAMIALEMDLPYASACSIDNFGNGLVEKPLSLEEIVTGTRKNADMMIRLVQKYIDEANE
ncbi:MAG: MTAP family purine nucleoside phosphorylase [Smithellaceae bacterium]|jgi:5'-methylthioadenosine phosphorylase|nr:MTAP family purine nucleoside phosphorylase [Smithellaceae bacterium]